MTRSVVDDARAVVVSILSHINVNVPVATSSSCRCPDCRGFEGLDTDVLGYEAGGTVYLCLGRIKRVAETYRIDFDALVAHVFYHELCHAILEGAEWWRIPRPGRPDEPYCEYAALKAIRGEFSVGPVRYHVKAVGPKDARTIAGLPRPPPYDRFHAYLVADLIGLGAFELLKAHTASYGVKPPTGNGSLQGVVLCTND